MTLTPDDEAYWDRPIEPVRLPWKGVLLQCPKGHVIGRAVEHGIHTKHRDGRYLWQPDLTAGRLGRIPVVCRTCRVQGFISVDDAMRAVHRRDKKIRLRISNPQP